MNSDSGEEAGLPYEIGEAASQGDFERVKAWLAGGSASDPRSIHSSGEYNWTLLHWTVARAQSPEYIEFARYLISHRRARPDEGAPRDDAGDPIHRPPGGQRRRLEHP